MTREQYLEVHKLISEELRHTSTVIWQFAIAIITLQGGAVGLSIQKGFEGILGTYVLIVAFFLSLCFSVLLLRQAYERRDFSARIRAIEVCLRQDYPGIFAPVDSGPLYWFKSVYLGWIIFAESILGFLGFVISVFR
jgi:hypothetical protein